MDVRIVRMLYLIVGTCTLLLPIALFSLFLYTGFIHSIYMDDKKQRMIPYFITFIFFYLAYYMVKKLAISSFISAFLFASALSLLIIVIVTYFWKISSHMTGMGGLTGLMLSLSVVYDTDTMYFLVILLLLSGLLASARISLNAHKPGEIYTGFVLGFITVFTVCLLCS
ncbi:MAG TPA: hypothetical protein VJ346_10400 [Bacteroidales bacterium]|nr:hypothetical protein [Bacteroidales bacterium]